MYAFFTDLRTTFDNVNSEILWRTLREKGVADGLIRRMKMINEETVVTVQMNQGMSEEFKTKKGVTQRCVLSSLLFNLYGRN